MSFAGARQMVAGAKCEAFGHGRSAQLRQLGLSRVRCQPSPLFRRVGVHIFTFEACSGFTRVTACALANLPGWETLSPQLRLPPCG